MTLWTLIGLNLGVCSFGHLFNNAFCPSQPGDDDHGGNFNEFLRLWTDSNLDALMFIVRWLRGCLCENDTWICDMHSRRNQIAECTVRFLNCVYFAQNDSLLWPLPMTIPNCSRKWHKFLFTRAKLKVDNSTHLNTSQNLFYSNSSFFNATTATVNVNTKPGQRTGEFPQ